MRSECIRTRKLRDIVLVVLNRDGRLARVPFGDVHREAIRLHTRNELGGDAVRIWTEDLPEAHMA